LRANAQAKSRIETVAIEYVQMITEAKQRVEKHRPAESTPGRPEDQSRWDRSSENQRKLCLRRLLVRVRRRLEARRPEMGSG
jgi:hypothetical protein